VGFSRRLFEKIVRGLCSRAGVNLRSISLRPYADSWRIRWEDGDRGGIFDVDARDACAIGEREDNPETRERRARAAAHVLCLLRSQV
jgi:hypothetical protein